jgi:hypothetical protein
LGVGVSSTGALPIIVGVGLAIGIEASSSIIDPEGVCATTLQHKAQQAESERIATGTRSILALTDNSGGPSATWVLGADPYS